MGNRECFTKGKGARTPWFKSDHLRFCPVETTSQCFHWRLVLGFAVPWKLSWLQEACFWNGTKPSWGWEQRLCLACWCEAKYSEFYAGHKCSVLPRFLTSQESPGFQQKGEMKLLSFCGANWLTTSRFGRLKIISRTAFDNICWTSRWTELTLQIIIILIFWGSVLF